MADLRLFGLSKTFPGQRALDDVDLQVESGQIHAFVGHNGSGKSTLIKILSGFHDPDPGSGTLEVDGHPVPLGDGAAAHSAGIRFLHQDLGLVDGLTVLENLRLGPGNYSTRFGGRIDWKHERESAESLLSALGLSHLSPDDEVNFLSAIEKTEVALARALQDRESVGVLVLDEPTAALPDEQVEHLFDLVRRLASSGVSIIYVSHRLEEVFELADQVTVLRDGRVVRSVRVTGIDQRELARLIAGQETDDTVADNRAVTRSDGAVMLAFENLQTGAELRGLDLQVRSGEVVGLAGLAGSGVNDVPLVLLGDARIEAGALILGSSRVNEPDPVRIAAQGVAVVPAARGRKQLPAMSLKENLTIADLTPFWRGGWFRDVQERRCAEDLVADYMILPNDVERSIETLSGGNQQKAYVARWLRTRPMVLVLEEPTQGVDVAGSMEIVRFARAAASDGVAVLLCSSDLEDLAGVCDRVVVMRDGRAAAELSGDAATREAIVEECYASQGDPS